SRIDVTRDLPLADERRHAVLLRDDDRERVRLLREPDRRAMARAERLRDVRVRREGQEAAGRGDAAVLDDERAVVDRRVGKEDARHELLRHLGVEPRADVDVLVQPDLVLEDDERADAPRGEEGDALHELLDGLVLRDAVARRVERARADLRERPADVVLEHDEDEDERGAEEVVEEDVQRVDLEPAGQEVDAVDEGEPDQHRDGPRAADEADREVDAAGEDEDVEAVLPAEALEQLDHVPALAIACATATTSAMAAASWTRTSRAPAATASATAAAVPKSRPPASRSPRTARMKLFRDGPTSTGYPSATHASRWRSKRRLSSACFPKPIPGSSTIASRATPAASAAAARSARNAVTSPTTSVERGS